MDFLALRCADCKIYGLGRSIIGRKHAQIKEEIMKLILTTLVFIILTVLAVSVEARPGKQSVSVQLHKEKSIPGAGFRIKFVEMVEDSRCPTGTTCIWAGNAKVKIEVRGGRGDSKTFELNSTMQPTIVTYAGYDIKLAGLTPKPAANVRIDPDKYLASFEVVKKRI